MNQLKSIFNSPFKDSHSHPIHTCFLIITACKRRFVKVMFLHLSVCPRGGGGGVPGQVYPPDQVYPQTRYTSRPGTPPGPGTTPRPGTPPAGTHPGRYNNPWAGTPLRPGTPPAGTTLAGTPLGRYTHPWAGTLPGPGTPPGQVHHPRPGTHPRDQVHLPPEQCMLGDMESTSHNTYTMTVSPTLQGRGYTTQYLHHDYVSNSPG